VRAGGLALLQLCPRGFVGIAGLYGRDDGAARLERLAWRRAAGALGDAAQRARLAEHAEDAGLAPRGIHAPKMQRARPGGRARRRAWIARSVVQGFPDFVLHAADGVLNLPSGLLRLAFALKLAIAGHFARDFLGLAFGLL